MKSWYLVDCEVVHPARYRIFAEDAESAIRMCLDHGEELHVLDITYVRPIYAHLEQDPDFFIREEK